MKLATLTYSLIRHSLFKPVKPEESTNNTQYWEINWLLNELTCTSVFKLYHELYNKDNFTHHKSNELHKHENTKKYNAILSEFSAFLLLQNLRSLQKCEADTKIHSFSKEMRKLSKSAFTHNCSQIHVFWLIIKNVPHIITTLYSTTFRMFHERTLAFSMIFSLLQALALRERDRRSVQPQRIAHFLFSKIKLKSRNRSKRKNLRQL